MKKLLAILFVLPVLANAQTFIYADTLNFTRPANPTAYAAGDIVNAAADSAILAFTKPGSYPGHNYIVGARLAVDTASTSGSFRLWIFKKSTGYVKIADNAAYTPTFDFLRTSLVGFIDFNLTTAGVGAGAGGNADFVSNLNIPFMSTDGAGLYGVLTATSAYTPKNAGKFWIALSFQRLLK